jgi:hypothetical protein
MSDVGFSWVLSVAAIFLAALAIYRTQQLAAFDWAAAHANSRNSDTVCDLIGEVQDLRLRVESLEKASEPLPEHPPEVRNSGEVTPPSAR